MFILGFFCQITSVDRHATDSQMDVHYRLQPDLCHCMLESVTTKFSIVGCNSETIQCVHLFCLSLKVNNKISKVKMKPCDEKVSPISLNGIQRKIKSMQIPVTITIRNQTVVQHFL